MIQLSEWMIFATTTPTSCHDITLKQGNNVGELHVDQLLTRSSTYLCFRHQFASLADINLKKSVLTHGINIAYSNEIMNMHIKHDH